MKNIMTITGIRPDFIRMSEIFKKLDKEFNHTLVHTGQHYDELMSGIFFDELDIRQPDYNLHIGKAGRTHYEQQADLTIKIMELMNSLETKPDLILFLGDTNSILACIPLKKEGYTLGHIEAGMRSYDRRMLEEINRVICDHTVDYHFVYHENNKKNLLKEGLPAENIFVVGNSIVEPLRKAIAGGIQSIGRLSILMDIHRPENNKNKDRMKTIIRMAKEYVKRFSVIKVEMLDFYTTTKYIKEFGIELGPEIELIPMMGYRDFLQRCGQSKFVISDSGTAQEEFALMGVKVIVPREFTERPESVENNCSFMIDFNSNTSFEESIRYLEHAEPTTAWLGDGTTSQQVIDIIKGL